MGGFTLLMIKDILIPRLEVREGKFQGVIQTNKVDSEEMRIESSPNDFLNITYPSLILKEILEKSQEKKIGRFDQGGFLLAGPYGSGKSHTLISLYHIFNNPNLGNEWAKKWDIAFETPQNSRSIILSTRNFAGDHLWIPIFKQLGREDLLKKVGRYPTIDQIEELIGDGPVAIFIDEIENWYGSFDRETQSHIIEQNETFLEHLLEVANDPLKKLFVFITFLEEKEELKKIFNRTKPIRKDISSSSDREKVILHRLFENAELVDSNKIEKIIIKYVEKYSEPIKVSDSLEYKRKMLKAYPFHPLLLKTLNDVYEAAAENQNIRGMLNTLADSVKDNYKKKDLILLSDISENEFRGMNLTLVEKYDYDLRRVEDIPFSKEILKSILIFSINEKTVGASESDILLSTFSPTQGDTISGIVMDIENIYGKPHYLYKEKDLYLFKTKLNIFALLELEKNKVKHEDVKNRVAEIVKRTIFNNKVFIYGFDEIPDNNKLKIVVSLESWGNNSDMRDKLNEFYHGKTWQNTFILIFPEIKTIFSFEVQEKVKRIVAAEILFEQIKDDRVNLGDIVKEDLESVANIIQKYYGRFVKWIEKDTGELIYRLINVSPDINIIREKSSEDTSYYADSIVNELENKTDGIIIENLINDFKKLRRLPIILDDNVIYNAIRLLHKDKRVIIQGQRGIWYLDSIPKKIDPEFAVFDPKFVPITDEKDDANNELIKTNGEKSTIETQERIESDGQDIANKEEGSISIKRQEKIRDSFEGNSARVILSQIETRTSEKDQFDEINIRFDFGTKMTKKDIMNLIKALPSISNDFKIEADVIFWRENDD